MHKTHPAKTLRPVVWAIMALGLSLIALQAFGSDHLKEIERQLERQRELLRQINSRHGHPPAKLVRPNYAANVQNASCGVPRGPMVPLPPRRTQTTVYIDYQKVVQCLVSDANFMAAIKGPPGPKGDSGECTLTQSQINGIVTAVSSKLKTDASFLSKVKGDPGKDGDQLTGLKVDATTGVITATYGNGRSLTVGRLPLTDNTKTEPQPKPEPDTSGVPAYFDVVPRNQKEKTRGP